MKKISISIPTPCHENWDAMKPEDKGRFCASCQKTVVDFSNMSDRQIAEFFKKPSGSLCGRFHNDQLNREIEIPRKRIPWIRYFFQITWPAFVLFLKSCGLRENMAGEIMVENAREADNRKSLLGAVIPEITPVDTLEEKVKADEIICPEGPATIGLIPLPPVGVVGDTVATVLPVMEEAVLKEYKPMDTVAISSQTSIRMGGLIAGGISISVSSEQRPAEIEEKTAAVATKINLYPNPVRSGMQLTIDATFIEDIPKQIQVFSANGNMTTIKQFNWTKGGNLTVTVPSSLAAGTYFVRIISENQQTETAKVIVIN